MWDLSSQTRAWTHVVCIGRWVLNHWTPREALWVRYYYDPVPLQKLLGSLLNKERKPPESRSIWLEFNESVLFSWGPEGFFFKETNDTDFPLMGITEISFIIALDTFRNEVILKTHVKLMTGGYCGDLANVWGRYANSWCSGTTLPRCQAGPVHPGSISPRLGPTCRLLQNPSENSLWRWCEVLTWGHLEGCGVSCGDRCPGSSVASTCCSVTPAPQAGHLPLTLLGRCTGRSGYNFCFRYTHW